MPCSEGYNNDDSESLVLNMAVCPEEGYLNAVWGTEIALPRIAAVAKETPMRIFDFHHQLSAESCGANLEIQADEMQPAKMQEGRQRPEKTKAKERRSAKAHRPSNQLRNIHVPSATSTVHIISSTIPRSSSSHLISTNSRLLSPGYIPSGKDAFACASRKFGYIGVPPKEHINQCIPTETPFERSITCQIDTLVDVSDEDVLTLRLTLQNRHNGSDPFSRSTHDRPRADIRRIACSTSVRGPGARFTV